MIDKFISNKLSKELSSGNKFSKPIIKVAIISIAISVLVMLVSISVVRGFQREIKNKVVNFSSHIQITDGGTNFGLETSPITFDMEFYEHIGKEPGVEHIQTFVTKAGIIQSGADTVEYKNETRINRDIEGIIFKGVDTDFNWANLNDKIIEGKPFMVNSRETNDSILVSNYLAKRLKLTVNQNVRAYFFNGNKPPISRRFVISGIFETGLEEFDNQFAFVDIKHPQKLNGWGISASLFMETNPVDDKIVVTANTTGGNENYRYIFNDGAITNFNTLSFCANKDTTIKVISTDFSLNTVTLESEPVSLPDTAWLKIKVNSTDGNCVTTSGEFDYESVNDSTRKYTGDNGFILTTLSSTGGTMKNYVGGFEIFIKDFADLEEQEISISRKADPFLKVSKITDLQSEIFGWLNVLDTNAIIIIILMIMVAVINIISLLLVIIVEKIRFIGIMKSFGSQNGVIQSIFVQLGRRILFKGMIYGNVIAVVLILLQKQFGFLKLPQDNYYLSTVPLGFEWMEFFVINLVTLSFGLIVLFITSLFVSNITPIKAIKFD